MSETDSLKVRLAGIVNESVTDGPGLRITLFFQGCLHHCTGCHNPHTWPMQAGTQYSISDLIAQLPDHPLIKGITLSGGDPFYQPQTAAALAREFHQRGKDVWTYTGFLWEDLRSKGDPAMLDLLSESDVLVDGLYVQDLRDVKLKFRGSSNQRLIDVRRSLLSCQLVEWKSLFDNQV